jgi:TetR/AcrR family transcriptional regulator, cholesterol catabolism regulator
MKMRTVVKKKVVVAQVTNPGLVKKKHEQIVHAAGEMFSKKGFHSTTMREISAISGINLSYLYKYVSSKDDILFLFYEHLQKQWNHIYQSINDLKNENMNPVDQLNNFLRSMLEIIHNLTDEILTMYTESRHLMRESLYSVLTTESEEIKALERLIIRGVNKGIFKTNDPFLTANFIQYLIVIEALRGWSFKDQYTYSRFVELFIDFILNALGIEKKKENSFTGFKQKRSGFPKRGSQNRTPNI